ncbi:hypothetical protein [Streptomyces sp. enrichment culture]|uniref:hypothetical protein n=1 Tax=Streptomyces sp. enrichment culture TaxID=1795815 RepID=UPI003F55DE81
MKNSIHRVLAAAVVTSTAVLVSAGTASADNVLDKFSPIGLGNNNQNSQGVNGGNNGSHSSGAGNNAVAHDLDASDILSDILNNPAIPVIG